MSKRIAVVGTVLGDVFGVGTAYMEWARQFGNVEIITPDSQIDPTLDLIIMQGGADVNPLMYGKRPEYLTSKGSPHLEYFDKVLLPQYIEAKVPIFGICRGLQAINVHFGGTLTQNLRYHPYSVGSRDADAHGVKTTSGETFKVNSLHHQAIEMLGEGLKDDAYSDDGEVEAIIHKTLKIAGVQWHPEEIWDDYSSELIINLME